jgi:NAD+ synthase (glutamine-hydrolysing)
LDAVLFQYIDEGKSPEEIIASGFERDTVERIIRLVNNAEFKRFQAPPILRVSNKAFGRARIMPVVSIRS